MLEDLKSTNGTFVNDRPIARHTLLEGDAVLVGKHTLLFTQKDGEQTEAPAERPVVPAIGGTRVLDTNRQKELLAAVDQKKPSPVYDAPYRGPRFQPRKAHRHDQVFRNTTTRIRPGRRDDDDRQGGYVADP